MRCPCGIHTGRVDGWGVAILSEDGGVERLNHSKGRCKQSCDRQEGGKHLEVWIDVQYETDDPEKNWGM